MEYRLLGSTGVRVSTFGLGAMMFGGANNTDRDECVRIVHKCLDAGVNFIDTADTYGNSDSERFLAEALKDGKRDDVVLATKCYFSRTTEVNQRGGSRRWIVRAVENSLERLGTDYIDILQLHRLDFDMDIEESLTALSDLIVQGKIRYGGTSGASGADLVECQWIADKRNLRRPAVEQAHYSALSRAAEQEILPTAMRHRIGVIVYGPLNGGYLTGKYKRNEEPAPDTRAGRNFVMSKWWDRSRQEIQHKFDVIEGLERIAKDHGLTLMELGLGFVAAHPAVSTILMGPRTEAHIDGLLASLDAVVPAEALQQVDELVPPGIDVDPSNFVGAKAVQAAMTTR